MRSLSPAVLLLCMVGCTSSKPSASSNPALTTPADAGGCAGGLVACSGRCVDVRSSVLDCGVCGKACALGQACRDGTCGASTLCGDAGTQTECNGQCVDLGSNTASCGDCGHACGALQACVAGVCQQPCPSNTVACGSDCIEPANHHRYCGATAGCGQTGGTAGQECGAEQLCVAGKCTTDCPANLTACGASCIDTKTDSAHCGTCATACTAGTACSRGQCCAAGTESCQGTCRNTQTDPLACGGCGISCVGGQTCVAGVCQ